MTTDTSPLLLSVIVPTYNERDNILTLLDRILEIVDGLSAEVIVVDDASPDGTGDVVRAISERDARARLVIRTGRRGLSGAVFEGVRHARGAYACVLDADLSHDPEEIPQMLATAREGYDVVIGSRYAPGGFIVGWPLWRRVSSRLLALLARVLLRLKPRDILTGYVLCRREALADMPTHYSANGFKFLVELLATGRHLRVAEWPILFQDRRGGASKASFGEILRYVVLCLRLLAWQVRGPGRSQLH